MERHLIGKTIGPYVLLEKLGAGGMATVYRAQNLQGDPPEVAVKILPYHLAANDIFYQRFEREARMAGQLQHPHILPVYGVGEHDGVPYIAMKIVDGGTLAELIHQGPVDMRQCARILAQIAAALDYAHRENVIHRDIKPENILFDDTEKAYLGDFGVARFSEGSEHITGTGGFVGTAAYASPEQCRGEELTATSDIYSLGVVLYEMLTGVLPFKGATPLATMHQHISEPVPNPLRERPSLPLGVAEVMRKALAKMSSVRYQSATAMSGALNEALRPILGTKPLADNAPPLGPDPVFDRPHNNSSPLQMPDELLRNLSPSRPKPIAPLPPAPPVEHSAFSPSMPERKKNMVGMTTIETVMLLLTLVTAAAVIVYVLLSR
ncbi:MAG: serine/threonine protein kinase [Chloroflexi bacterium]|nr:serine/threonine protein kinase [Chloroflexota bacterium]